MKIKDFCMNFSHVIGITKDKKVDDLIKGITKDNADKLFTTDELKTYGARLIQNMESFTNRLRQYNNDVPMRFMGRMKRGDYALNKICGDLLDSFAKIQIRDFDQLVGGDVGKFVRDLHKNFTNPAVKWGLIEALANDSKDFAGATEGQKLLLKQLQDIDKTIGDKKLKLKMYQRLSSTGQNYMRMYFHPDKLTAEYGNDVDRFVEDYKGKLLFSNSDDEETNLKDLFQTSKNTGLLDDEIDWMSLESKKARSGKSRAFNFKKVEDYKDSFTKFGSVADPLDNIFRIIKRSSEDVAIFRECNGVPPVDYFNGILSTIRKASLKDSAFGIDHSDYSENSVQITKKMVVNAYGRGDFQLGEDSGLQRAWKRLPTYLYMTAKLSNPLGFLNTQIAGSAADMLTQKTIVWNLIKQLKIAGLTARGAKDSMMLSRACVMGLNHQVQRAQQLLDDGNVSYFDQADHHIQAALHVSYMGYNKADIFNKGYMAANIIHMLGHIVTENDKFEDLTPMMQSLSKEFGIGAANFDVYKDWANKLEKSAYKRGDLPDGLSAYDRKNPFIQANYSEDVKDIEDEKWISGLQDVTSKAQNMGINYRLNEYWDMLGLSNSRYDNELKKITTRFLRFTGNFAIGQTGSMAKGGYFGYNKGLIITQALGFRAVKMLGDNLGLGSEEDRKEDEDYINYQSVSQLVPQITSPIAAVGGDKILKRLF